jgi:predicted XRE-type DNA-binding protein
MRKGPMSIKTEVSPSSGNVFADLGFERPDEELMRAELVQRIRRILQRRRLTQVQAARLLGIDQPKVSALMRGHLAGFSTDRLIRFLKALDRDVEIVIKRRPRSRQARVTVVDAPTYGSAKAG